MGDGGIFTGMLQSIVNAALEGEIDHHLKEQPYDEKGNRRNGHTQKIVRSPAGPLQVQTPGTGKGAMTLY